VLAKIGIKNTDSVLDIGCGCGEFVQYCKDNHLKISYFGVDINPHYLQIAKVRFPKETFAISNGWDLTSMDYDWAIASGVFTLEASITYVLWYVGFVMERLVKKGFAFNLLNNKAPEGLMQYDPSSVLRELKERFPEYKMEIAEGYLPDDFTIYVTK
jgi:trans-aconitate methyltransferase